MVELIINGVEIDLGREQKQRPITDFITPDFHYVFEFFPEWVKQVRALGREPWPIQPYILEVCKQLVKLEARPGRTEQDWFNRIIEYFGFSWFEKNILKYKGLV